MSEHYDREALKPLVLSKYLSGIIGARSIAVSLNMPDAQYDIQQVMDSKDFMSTVRAAKRDMATSVIDTIKLRLHEYREKMEDLALKAGDPRVQFQALKDLLDRGGTGAAKQISLTSPAAYKKALEEFKEEPNETPTDISADPVPDRSNTSEGSPATS